MQTPEEAQKQRLKAGLLIMGYTVALVGIAAFVTLRGKQKS